VRAWSPRARAGARSRRGHAWCKERGAHAPTALHLTRRIRPRARVTGAGAARAQATATSVRLAWTAPGDDSLSGRGTRYDLRWSTAPITTLAQFSIATLVTGMNAPQTAGAGESATVSGLVPSTTYWFALRTFDEAGNGSALSNLLQATTSASPDQERPAPVTLALLGASTSSATLGWQDVGDDSLAGTATAVEIRWSTAPIDDTNWNAAVPVYGEPTPDRRGRRSSSP
jgi:chitodextrinase